MEKQKKNRCNRELLWGRRIRDWRLKAGISVQRLAFLACVGEQALIDLETGKQKRNSWGIYFDVRVAIDAMQDKAKQKTSAA